MSNIATQLAWAVCHPRTRRPVPRPDGHAMTRDEARWFHIQGTHRQAFGNPDAARVATLAVYDIDLLDRREVARG